MRRLSPPTVRDARRAFTLVELLVVVGIIAVLVGILLPTLNKARAAAESVKCLSNLHQLGIATAQYEVETKGFLPYPVASLSGDNTPYGTTAETMVWYNVLDPYLQNMNLKNANGLRRTTPIKQCPVWLSFGDADPNKTSGAQDAHEATRTYKMNTHLRYNNVGRLPPGTASTLLTYRPAKASQVPNATNFVYLGDGLGIDTSGPQTGSTAPTESTAFDFEVNRSTNANPSLRHAGGANILFVDLHAAHVMLKTITKSLNNPYKAVTVNSWQSEYLDSSGTPTTPSGSNNGAQYLQTMEADGLTRNPKMPLQWSQLGKLYAPPGT